MFSRQEKIILLILASLQFSHILDFVIMMPLGPQLMRTFGLSAQEFSFLISSYLFTGTISGVISALFIDKYDRKKSLMFFYLGFALGTLGCTIAPNYITLLIMRSIAGLFGGVLASIVLSIASDSIDVSKRGAAMGIIMSSFSVASTFGIPFGLYLANAINWHAPFSFLGLFSLIMTGAIYYFLPPMRDHLKGPHQSKGVFESWAHIAKDSNQLTTLAFMSALMLGQFTIIPFLSPSLVANAGLSEAHLPFVYLVGGLVSMVTSPTTGFFVDKIGKKKVGIIGLLLSVVPIYLITHLTSLPTVQILIFSSSFFFVMSLRMVPAMSISSTVVSPKYRGSFMSVLSSVQSFSNAIASYVAGLIVIRTPTGQLENYTTVGWLAIGFTLLAAFLLYRIKPAEGPSN